LFVYGFPISEKYFFSTRFRIFSTRDILISLFDKDYPPLRVVLRMRTYDPISQDLVSFPDPFEFDDYNFSAPVAKNILSSICLAPQENTSVQTTLQRTENQSLQPGLLSSSSCASDFRDFTIEAPSNVFFINRRYIFETKLMWPSLRNASTGRHWPCGLDYRPCLLHVKRQTQSSCNPAINFNENSKIEDQGDITVTSKFQRNGKFKHQCSCPFLARKSSFQWSYIIPRSSASGLEFS
jgi:hypothetical protein